MVKRQYTMQGCGEGPSHYMFGFTVTDLLTERTLVVADNKFSDK